MEGRPGRLTRSTMMMMTEEGMKIVKRKSEHESHT